MGMGSGGRRVAGGVLFGGGCDAVAYGLVGFGLGGVAGVVGEQRAEERAYGQLFGAGGRVLLAEAFLLPAAGAEQGLGVAVAPLAVDGHEVEGVVGFVEEQGAGLLAVVAAGLDRGGLGGRQLAFRCGRAETGRWSSEYDGRSRAVAH